MKNWHLSAATGLAFLVLALSSCTKPPPTPNDKNISPPWIYSPIYSGTEVVAIGGGHHKRTVEIWSNAPERVASGTVNVFGRGPLRTSRPLTSADMLTGYHIDGSLVSYPTVDAVPVLRDIPPEMLVNNNEKFRQPEIVEPVYECQRGVRVEGLVQGVRVNYEIETRDKLGNITDVQRGAVWTPYDNVFAGYSPEFEEDQSFRARQEIPGTFGASDWDTATVVAMPPDWESNKKYKPDPVQPSVGARVVVVLNCTIGAEVRIYQIHNGQRHLIRSGTAYAEISHFAITPLPNVSSSDKLHIDAEQFLCGKRSLRSEPVEVNRQVPLPRIREPICTKARKVVVRNTEPGADVQIRINYKSAIKGELTGQTTTPVTIGGPTPLLEVGDQIQAQQCNEFGLCSGWTASVMVSGPIAAVSFFNIGGKGSVQPLFDWITMGKDWPSVGIVIFNPASGPRDKTTNQFPSWLEPQLQHVENTGLPNHPKILGYVWGPSADAAADIQTYWNDWGQRLDGIYFDGVPADPDSNDIQQYEDLRQEVERFYGDEALVAVRPKEQPVESTGANMNMEDYLATGVADVLMIFENDYQHKDKSDDYVGWDEPQWVTRYSPCRFWHVVHGAESNDLQDILKRFNDRHAGWIYIKENSTYHSGLPDFWDEQLKLLLQ